MVAIRGLSAARDLPPEVIFDALKDALVSAYHKMPESTAGNVTVDFDDDGHAHVYSHYAVVDEAYLEDPSMELSPAAARELDASAKIGDIITRDVTPSDFGRIAAQTAKQVILQRIREAEREQTYSTYADREGEIVYGVVQTANRDLVTVALDRVEAVLPKSGQIPGERYAPNQRVRVYVAEVKRSPKGPQVIVSRTHREMLRRLMELEIPEIFQGVVEVKAIAREAGSRSKVAVWASQQGVDPVGACVGMRGVRIQALVRELGGEKIDIVEWEADPRVFIAHALSPAQVMHVWLEEEGDRRTANVVVPDHQLSLAIGREGQNARLAAKLTGWRIDIRSESEAGDLIERLRTEKEVQSARAAAAAARAEAEAAAALNAATPAAETVEAAEPDAIAAAPELDVAAAESTQTAAADSVTGADRAATRDSAAADSAPLAPAAEAGAAPEGIATEPGAAPAAPTKAPATDKPADGEPASRWDAIQAEQLARRRATFEDDEDELDESLGKGQKRKPRKLVRDPKTGEIIAKVERKNSRRRPEWEEEIGRWSEDELEDALGFTEYDFLGDEDDAEDEA
ncbi:MAG: transcription termination/antitermination protein NusA [Caldilineae bacterium]|nr:transcription termination/antitermination protein NusA [Caldilineae bacterium]